MALLSITVRNKENKIMSKATDTEECRLVYKDCYLHGDTIEMEVSETNRYVIVSVDDVLGSSFSYITEPKWTYTIPFEEERLCYSPNAFTGGIHLLSIRYATEQEIKAYKNLALNVNDQHGAPVLFPHASANVETRGESIFAAKNAINGNRENSSHGTWPYESWGINRDDHAVFRLEFGRMVTVDKIVLYTRSDFPHDNWWNEVTLQCSDGSEIVWGLEKSSKAHVLELGQKNIEWLTLSKLKKAEGESPFPALSQMEVYGVEAKN